MRLKCIQTLFYWWGSVFVDGRWYDGVEKTSEKRLIIDHDQYIHYMRKVSSRESIKLAKMGLTQLEIKKHIPDYLTLTEIGDRFTVRLEFPFAEVIGDDGSREQFCLLNNKTIRPFLEGCRSDEVSDKIDLFLSGSGEIKFDISVRMFDDWFIDVEEIRERKLGSLGI